MTHLDGKALEAANDLAREEFGVMVGSVGPAYITAYISALLPEDAAGLVAELTDQVAPNWEAETGSREPIDRAASRIQSQAAGWAADKARIAALEAGLEAAVQTMRNSRGAIESNQIEDKDVWRQLARGIEAARVLLNGERKG